MIEHLLELHTHAPVRWLGERMGIASTNGVRDHIVRLERKGYIERVEKPSAGAQHSCTWRILRHPDGSPFRLRSKRGGR